VGRQLEETYAKTGAVRFEYKHFAFLGPESIRAAEASECASEQERFWPYHDTLFLNQRGENMGAFNDEALKAFAAGIGLVEEEFNRCLDSGRYRDEVEAERVEAAELGIGRTPSTVINGQIVDGSVPFERLQVLIESELAQSSGG
jgi:protein-disulfide isomerase